MSETTKVKTVPVKDIAALQAAVAELNQLGKQCRLVTNQIPRMYFQDQHGACPYVVQLDGPYDVGFALEADGSYSPVFDNFCGRVSDIVGAACPVPKAEQHQDEIGLLMQLYSKHAAVNVAVNAGHIVESCYVDENHNVQLLIQA